MRNAPKLPAAHCGVMRVIAGIGRELKAFQGFRRGSPPFIP